MAKPAVFLDRDGVINVDHGYVHDEHDFQFIEGVFEATAALQRMGYLLVLVTNQSGIARGKFSEERFISLTQWMDWNFADNGLSLMVSIIVRTMLNMALGNTKKSVIAANLSRACFSRRAIS